VFHSAAVRELTFLALMAPGFAFFWTLLRVDLDAGEEEQHGQEGTNPWWEDDPRFTSRFKPT